MQTLTSIFCAVALLISFTNSNYQKRTIARLIKLNEIYRSDQRQLIREKDLTK